MAQGAPGIESGAVKTDYDSFSEENLARVRAKQRTSVHSPAEGASIKNRENPPDKQRKLRKRPEVEFLKLDLVLLHKLRRVNAPCIASAMVYALSEAWFRTGICSKHLNPFPLLAVDTKKWELDRSQKMRALHFLVRNRFINVDRSDPSNPFVTLLWVPQQP